MSFRGYRDEGLGLKDWAKIYFKSNLFLYQKKLRIMERKQSIGFRRIFTVDFLLFLAPAGPFPNPVGGNHKHLPNLR